MTAVTLEQPAGTFDRSHQQRLDSLRHANEIRTGRAKLKQDIKAGGVSVRALLFEPPVLIATMKLYDLALAIPMVGRVKATTMLRQCGIASSKTVGGLSERQRHEFIRLLSQ